MRIGVSFPFFRSVELGQKRINLRNWKAQSQINSSPLFLPSAHGIPLGIRCVGTTGTGISNIRFKIFLPPCLEAAGHSPSHCGGVF